MKKTKFKKGNRQDGSAKRTNSAKNPPGDKKKTCLRAWTDGSFKENKDHGIHAGCSAVFGPNPRQAEKGKRIQGIYARTVSEQAKTSTEAELWGIALALSEAPKNSLTHLYTDNQKARAVLQEIITERIKGFIQDVRLDEYEVMDAIRIGVLRQAELEAKNVVCIGRGEVLIPIANKFAQAASQDTEEAIRRKKKQVNAPITFFDSRGVSFKFEPHKD